MNATLIDTGLSSGDASSTNSKKVTEENNNEITELTNDLNEMSCNIGTLNNSNDHTLDSSNENDNLASSDDDEIKAEEKEYLNEEFDQEDSTDIIESSLEVKSNVKVSESKLPKPQIYKSNEHDIKSAKSQSSFKSLHTKVSHSSIKTTKTMVSRSTNESSDRFTSKSTNCVAAIKNNNTSQSKRFNMSFSNDKTREIERENYILLNKIMSARYKKSTTIPPAEGYVRLRPPALTKRKRQELDIQRENLILLRKIQGAKPSTRTFRQ